MRNVIALIAVMLLTGCIKTTSPLGSSLYETGTSDFNKDAYGLGVHSDQYGRPVTVQPAHGSGNTSDSYIQTRDAYGPGMHSDQYGRPVVVVPRY